MNPDDTPSPSDTPPEVSPYASVNNFETIISPVIPPKLAEVIDTYNEIKDPAFATNVQRWFDDIANPDTTMDTILDSYYVLIQKSIDGWVALNEALYGQSNGQNDKVLYLTNVVIPRLLKDFGDFLTQEIRNMLKNVGK